jgi:hypothetical protein
MASVYDKIKWDRIGQVSSNIGNGIRWYRILDHPSEYHRTDGMGLNAGEWKGVAMWHIKYKTSWQIIKCKIKKLIINDN